MDFPHLSNNPPSFPSAGRALYEQLPGAFDSSLWTEGAKVTLTCVPWGRYDERLNDSVPGFDTAADRAAWFADWLRIAQNETHELDTRVRYQMDEWVDLPFTFDKAIRYNYCIVEYPAAPVAYEGSTSTWYYHVTDVSYKSANCTRVMLDCDWWTTFVPQMGISQVGLLRGHAPLDAVSASAYLSDPATHNAYLMAPDIDYGGASKTVTSSLDTVFNDVNEQVWAVFVLKSTSIDNDTRLYSRPEHAVSALTDSLPGGWAFACYAADFPSFVASWRALSPQTMACLQCVVFLGASCIELGTTFQAFDWTLVHVTGGQQISVKLDLTKEAFGYDASVADFAKLYTAPYAHIELASSTGQSIPIDIETISGDSLGIVYDVQIALSSIGISALSSNAGGPSRSVHFANIGQGGVTIGGVWYDVASYLPVPTYALQLDSYQNENFSNYYNRQQSYRQNETSYDNATASNATAQENVNASNATARTNAANTAANITGNAAITAAANTSTTATTVAGNSQATALSNALVSATGSFANASSTASYDAEKDGLTVSQSNLQLNTIANGVTGLLTGAAASFVGDSGGALTSLANVVNAGVGYATGSASLAVSQSNADSIYSATISANNASVANTTSNATASTSNSNDVMTTNTATNNNANTSIAANNASLTTTNANNTANTSDANAAKTKNTSDANAARSKNTSDAGVQAAWDNASMQGPVQCGSYNNTELAATRPLMWSLNVVTEPKGCIMQAGAQFARYGYTLNQPWDFKTWNVHSHFSYWQCDWAWANAANQVPERAESTIRAMLAAGVTCWADPAEIGEVGIYDND